MRRYRIMIMSVLLAMVGRTLADNLTVGTVTMSAGEKRQVAIWLSNPSYKYAAFQFDLVLPEGISIAKDAKGKLVASLNDDRKDDHTLNVSATGTNTYRFLSFSMTNTEFYGTDGALVYVNLQVNGNIGEGKKTATIKSQVFTGISGEQYKWAERTFTIQIQPTVVPIIMADDKTREYGEDNPVLTYQTSSPVTGVPMLTTTATRYSSVGEYGIVVGKGSVDENYKAINGRLTVTKAPLTISCGTYTMKQGEALPAFMVDYYGFKNHESETVLTKQPTLTCEASPTSEPGEYDIMVSGAEAENYNISYVAGKLIVTGYEAEAVVVTAKSYTREYGEANPKFEYEVSGAELDGELTITCEATSASPVGEYDIVVSKGTVNNYNDEYVAGKLTITKAPLTITAKSYTRKQGEQNPKFEVDYEGWKNGETAAVLTKQPALACEATAGSAIGTYDITISGAEAENYDISYVAGKLTVTDADAVVITAKSYTRQYGDANPTFGYEVSGAALEGEPTITCVATSASPVGEYDIVVSKGTVKNYNDKYVAGKLTITKAPLTITARSYTRKQGEQNPKFDVSYEGWKNGETAAVLTKLPVLACDATAASEPGGYDIKVSGAEAENYDISYVAGKLTVTDADAVVVTAKSYTRQYGDANPTFGYEVSGAALDGEPTITCEATSASPVGEYDIVVSKGTVKNYNDKYVAGKLTITKAPLTITARSYTRKQGEQNPKFEVDYAGWKNNETEAMLTKLPIVTCEAEAGSAIGTYDITASGAEATNYDISYVAGKLTVTMADLVTVTAKSYTRVYGDDNPVFEYETSGATLEGEPLIECEATSASPVGKYTIKISKGGVKNYNDKYVAGTLTITKAPLTITANSYTRKQGEANPTLEVTFEGLKNGDTEDVLTRRATVSCDAKSSSAPGEYEITVRSGRATNYDITLVSGKLTVTEADPVTVTAKSYSRVYGEANPKFEYEVSGAALDGEPVVSCEATKTSPVGEYDIVVLKGKVKNYNDKYIAGKLTITKAPLTITAKSYIRKQGEENPKFEVAYEGWKNGETEAVLTKLPVISCMATATSKPGEYAIVVSGAEAENYDISYVTGKLTVVEADAVVVTAKSYSRMYGEANPTFGYEVSGAALDGKPFISCEATATSPIGEYDIVVSKGTVKNYNDKYVAGKLTVTPAPLTAKVGNATRFYGEDNPQFTTTFVGFVNGDTERVLTNKGSYVTEATTTSDVGVYEVTLTGVEAKNYVLDKVESGKLTIYPAPLTAKVGDATKTYGEDNPQFTTTFIGLVNGDTKHVLTNKGNYVTAATKDSDVGAYEVTQTGVEAKNYVLDKVESGTLTINPAPLTAKVGDAMKTYGEDNPQFTTTFMGFVNGDTERVLTNKGSYVTTATKNSDVGVYEVTLTCVEAKNYVLDKVEPGTLTIEQAEQQIVWNQELGDIEQFKQMELSATATSGLPVSYQVSQGSDVCSVVKIGNATFLDCFGTGDVTLSAWQEGNKNYYPTLRTYKQVKVVPTGIGHVEAGDYTVVTKRGQLLIGGLKEGDTVQVTDLAGRTVYSGDEPTVNVARGSYIVRIGKLTWKVLVK